jgi:hypothetical protein
MIKAVHTVADAILKKIRRSELYYKRYNNNLQWKINHAYVTYAQECRKEYAKNHDTNFGTSPLIKNPASQYKGAMSAETAKMYSEKITALIEQNHECVIQNAEHKDLQTVIQQPLDNLGEGLLDVLRNPEVDKALMTHFKGYYSITAISAFRSFPSEKLVTSWLWHSDCYPTQTCKLFLHLTRADEETGATDFMTVEDTMAYRKAGYFGLGGERIKDVEGFAKDHNIPYRPFHINAAPGDATIFDMNFFHRAVSPVADYRDVVQLFFQPSPIPWEEDYKLNGELLKKPERGFAKDPRFKEKQTAGMM